MTKTSETMTEKQKYQLRRAIARFCSKPRKMQEVRDKFKISGISAGAYLSALRLQGVCECDGTTKRYVKVKGKRVKK